MGYAANVSHGFELFGSFGKDLHSGPSIARALRCLLADACQGFNLLGAKYTDRPDKRESIRPQVYRT